LLLGVPINTHYLERLETMVARTRNVDVLNNVLGPPRFQLGRILATAGAIQTFPMRFLGMAVAFHERGRWGEQCPEDAAANERAVQAGERVISCYSRNGVRLWVITEADRSVTTCLLPSEY